MEHSWPRGHHDKVARIWDVQSGEVICTLQGHARAVRSLAFSSDGRQLATGSLDGTAKVWDIDSGSQLQSLGQYRFAVDGVGFVSQDRQIVMSAMDKALSLWDIETGTPDPNAVSRGSGTVAILPQPRPHSNRYRRVSAGPHCTFGNWIIERRRWKLSEVNAFVAAQPIFSPDGAQIAGSLP